MYVHEKKVKASHFCIPNVVVVRIICVNAKRQFFRIKIRRICAFAIALLRWIRNANLAVYVLLDLSHTLVPKKEECKRITVSTSMVEWKRTTRQINSKRKKREDEKEKEREILRQYCERVWYNAGYLLRALPFSLLEEHQIPRRMQYVWYGKDITVRWTVVLIVNSRAYMKVLCSGNYIVPSPGWTRVPFNGRELSHLSLSLHE